MIHEKYTSPLHGSLWLQAQSQSVSIRHNPEFQKTALLTSNRKIKRNPIFCPFFTSN